MQWGNVCGVGDRVTGRMRQNEGGGGGKSTNTPRKVQYV